MNVFYVPDMKKNLFSILAAMKKGVTFKMDESGCFLYRNGDLIGSGTSYNGLLRLQCLIHRCRSSNIVICELEVCSVIEAIESDWNVSREAACLVDKRVTSNVISAALPSGFDGITSTGEVALINITYSTSMELWHKRLGHTDPK
jgi:hypothetical protein